MSSTSAISLSSSDEDDCVTDSRYEKRHNVDLNKLSTVFHIGNVDGEAVSGPVQHEVIDIDTSPEPNEDAHNENKLNDNTVDGTPPPVRPRGAESHRSSYKRKARLSRMLQTNELSSSDEEDLYTIGRIPQRSLENSPNRRHSSMAELRYGRQIYDICIDEDAVEDEARAEKESVPMNVLSKIATPELLMEVKAHLRKVRRSLKRSEPEPSPALLWEMRKKQQADKVLLNKTQAAKIKAGWKVRECLNSLPDGETANTFYLTLVKKGLLREVDALFSLAKVSENLRNFDKNFRNDEDKSALTIAIDNEDESMMSKLISHEVCLGISIFHAIENDFMEGLKLLIMYDPCIDIKITSENPYFQFGLTPMLLAAHNNNYRMLYLLHEYGHRITELTDWVDGIHVAWESANERRMICSARAQPAYITLTTEVNRMNPMKYCLHEIKRGKKFELVESEFSSFHKEIRNKLEDYMCSLLDFVCSSEELADLFQFDYSSMQSKTQQMRSFVDSAKTKRWSVGNRFELLEKASRENLVRFVTHQQSQLALSYLRFRSVPFLKNTLVGFIIGLMFPFLSIFYIIAPRTLLGSIITFPVVSFYCHMMSDISFAVVLLLNILLKDANNYRLGAPVTPLEWLIFIWIIGKWVQEMQEFTNRGLKAYLRDYWNYTDLILLLLFSSSFLVRLFDYFYNRNAAPIPRYEWGPFQPRLIAEGLKAWAYVFVFMRLLGLTRVHRYLGPLQISLAKMLFDILRFMCLFFLTMGAFAFGLSELYWYYGTEEGLKTFCPEKNTTSDNNGTDGCPAGQAIGFTSLGDAIVQLFWALFGIFEYESMSLHGKHVYTEYIGKTLLATFHIVAIIVMLNMLIAMMSNSYQATSEHEDTAWKFHRTSIWIRFIRREVIRPPPMNLFPNPWRISENLRRLKNFCRNCWSRQENLTEDIYDDRGRRIRRSRTVDSELSTYLNSTKKEEPLAVKMASKSIRRSKSMLIARENRFEMTVKPQVVITACATAPTSPKSSKKRQKHGQGFSPAVLAGIQSTLRLNFRAHESKAVLQKLARRYKLKYLVAQKK